MAKTLFTDEHEWLTIDGDVATVGITSHAQEQLGDLVYVELPQIGRAVKKGEEAAVVESVKAASDVYSPVSGEIVAVNSEVTGDPALVNRAPQGDGWLMKIRLADKSELDAMMDAAAYAKFVG